MRFGRVCARRGESYWIAWHIKKQGYNNGEKNVKKLYRKIVRRYFVIKFRYLSILSIWVWCYVPIVRQWMEQAFSVLLFVQAYYGSPNMLFRDECKRRCEKATRSFPLENIAQKCNVEQVAWECWISLLAIWWMSFTVYECFLYKKTPFFVRSLLSPFANPSIDIHIERVVQMTSKKMGMKRKKLNLKCIRNVFAMMTRDDDMKTLEWINEWCITDEPQQEKIHIYPQKACGNV